MTRKDTIMIAVLVNAALLVALFVSAIKTDTHSGTTPVISSQTKSALPVSSQSIVEIKPLPAEPKIKLDEIKATQGDEIDQVLKEFSERKIVLEEKSSSKTDFAKELEAITKSTQSQKKSEPVASSSKDFIEVVVKKGDVLEKFGRTYQISVDEILKYNHLSSTNLRVGQVLKIPQKGSTQVAEVTTPKDGDTLYYTVKQGDNPWSIAVKNNLKLEQLLKLNDLNQEKAKHLRPGDKLRIR